MIADNEPEHLRDLHRLLGTTATLPAPYSLITPSPLEENQSQVNLSTCLACLSCRRGYHATLPALHPWEHLHRSGSNPSPSCTELLCDLPQLPCDTTKMLALHTFGEHLHPARSNSPRSLSSSVACFSCTAVPQAPPALHPSLLFVPVCSTDADVENRNRCPPWLQAARARWKQRLLPLLARGLMMSPVSALAGWAAVEGGTTRRARHQQVSVEPGAWHDAHGFISSLRNQTLKR